MAVKSPADIEVPFYPTWMNTMNGQPEWERTHIHGWMGEACEAAWKAGYRFLIWNGRVIFLEQYSTDDDPNTWRDRDTGWVRADVDSHTAFQDNIKRYVPPRY